MHAQHAATHEIFTTYQCVSCKRFMTAQVYGTSITGDVDNQADLQAAFDDLFVEYGVLLYPLHTLSLKMSVAVQFMLADLLAYLMTSSGMKHEGSSWHVLLSAGWHDTLRTYSLVSAWIRQLIDCNREQQCVIYTDSSASPAKKAKLFKDYFPLTKAAFCWAGTPGAALYTRGTAFSLTVMEPTLLQCMSTLAMQEPLSPGK